MIPPFNPSNNYYLPPGIHQTIWDEFIERYAYNKPRRRLIKGLELLIKHLKDCGCSRIWVDGSFVTQKESPKDIDGCYNLVGMDLAKLSKQYSIIFNADKNAQKRKYECEFFPAEMPSGRPGEIMKQFFQYDRDGTAKGILELNI